MSGMMLNIVGGSFAPALPTVIGQAFGGGFYAGQIGVSSVATHYLIVAPLSSGQFGPDDWKNANTFTPNSDSVIDGPQNTADIVADGNSTVYPCAHFCNNLSTGGQTDWYMPAKNEVEVCYYNLKPTTETNNTSSGINPNAVPARASNYTSGTPAQTSASAFQVGNSEAFDDIYWTSTIFGNGTARTQQFRDGRQTDYSKTSNYKVRAVRRIPV